MNPIRLVLADDHAVLRVGLRAFLEEQTTLPARVIGEAATGQEAVALVASLRPDLLLLDLNMGGMGGLEATIELRRRELPVRILVLTQYAETIYMRRVLEAGANGYLLKSARGDELLCAVRAVAGGGTYLDPSLAGLMVHPGQSGVVSEACAEEAYAHLTQRERQVLKLVAEGLSNKEIATALDVALKTVMTHRVNLMDKLGIHNHSRLVQFSIRVGLLQIV